MQNDCRVTLQAEVKLLEAGRSRWETMRIKTQLQGSGPVQFACQWFHMLTIGRPPICCKCKLLYVRPQQCHTGADR